MGADTERDLSESAQIGPAWHQIAASLDYPTSGLSMRFTVAVGTQTANSAPVVNFDTDDFEGTALSASLVSFTAARSQKGVVVRWRTGTEVDELGFNVYRQVGARRVRLNRRVLPALGRLAGASYSFLDRHTPQRAVRYWLQDVSVAGARTWHGPLRVPAA